MRESNPSRSVVRSMPLSRPIGGCTALALALVAAACAGPAVHPSPRPIEPVATETRFEARRLTDPDLAAFAATRQEFRVRRFPPTTWDLAALAVAALHFHPSLVEAQANIQEAEAVEITAGARPNPTLSFSPEVVAGSFSGVSPWTLGFALDVPIETGGKRGARLIHALRASDVARLQLAEAAWRVRSRLRVALADLLFAERAAALADREAAVREDYRAMVAKRFQVGEASRPDVQVAEADAAQTHAAALRANGRIAEARTQLAASIGVPTAALEGVTLDWPRLETPPLPGAIPLATVREAGLLHRLDVRRGLAEHAETEAALQVEVTKQYPDIHLGPGYAWDQGDNKFALGLSVTLPVFDRNQGPIAEALARRRSSEARFLTLQADVIAQTERATAAYAAANTELVSAQDLVSRLTERESVATRATEVGEEDALSLAGIRVGRIAAERARLDAARRTQEALAQLEDAMQRPLVDDPTAPPLVPAAGGSPK